jgi:hypothetical protein
VKTKALQEALFDHAAIMRREGFYDAADLMASARIELEILDRDPPPGTIPVRIAVWVGPDGIWGCVGSDDLLNPEQLARDICRGGNLVSIITAHVPKPTIPAIAGTVESN